MRHILAKRNAGVLARFAKADPILVLDYDGTLAPIARDPRATAIRAETRSLLEELVDRYACAVLSGRSTTKLLQFLAGTPVPWILGESGATRRAPELFKRRVRRWRSRLRKWFSTLSGVELVRQRCGLVIAYQRARDRTVIERAIGRLRGVTTCRQANAICLAPEGAPHKGFALRRLRAMSGHVGAIYVGDDATDEEVFGLRDPDVLGIRIGRCAASSASYYLRDQREIDELFRCLLRVRAAQT